VVFTVSGIPGDTFTLNYFVRANGNGGRVTLTDTLYGVQATGQVQIQFKPQAFNVGSFAFGLIGENEAPARYAVIGAMCTSSPTFLQADFANQQSAGSTIVGTASGWSLNPGDATTGRTTTTQLSFTNGFVMNLTLYGVNGGKAYVMESSPTASSTQVLSGVMTGFKGQLCLPTGNGGSFNNSSLVNSVFGATSQGGGNALAALGVVNNIAPGGGAGCAAGQGSASVTADENSNGSGGHFPAPVAACYQVGPVGRTELTFTDPLTNKQSGGLFYLDGTGGGYLIGLGTAIPYGSVQSQAAPPPLPPIGGNYGFAPFSFPSALLPVTSVAINATSATTGTIADNSAGGSCNGAPCAYTLDTTTGRGTATLNNANTFGDTSVVFYELGGNQLYIMDGTSATPMAGGLLQ